MHRNSQLEYQRVLDSLITKGSRWLDIGCGTSVLPLWLRNSVEIQRELIARCDVACGCDPVDDRPHAAGLPKYVGDCSTLPYPDNFFTIVTANMVVEHVDDPARFASEVRRVLAPGGTFVLHTPNLHHPLIALAAALPNPLVRWFASHADGRDSADIFPTRYRINTPTAIRSLPGFELQDLQCVATGPLLHKIPLLRSLESLFMRQAEHSRLRNLQADWIALLRKPAPFLLPAAAQAQQPALAA
ncbi:MAG TPA: methyltransferase domain-containing protein [Acidobacteriaceae bacterium]|nr:methyltransferase domain-containing protein [Acidobacteriaceae bacterium]